MAGSLRGADPRRPSYRTKTTPRCSLLERDFKAAGTELTCGTTPQERRGGGAQDHRCSLGVPLGSVVPGNAERPRVDCLLWRLTWPGPPRWATQSPKGSVKVGGLQGREDPLDGLQTVAPVTLVILGAFPPELCVAGSQASAQMSPPRAAFPNAPRPQPPRQKSFCPSWVSQACVCMISPRLFPCPHALPELRIRESRVHSHLHYGCIPSAWNRAWHREADAVPS